MSPTVSALPARYCRLARLFSTSLRLSAIFLRDSSTSFISRLSGSVRTRFQKIGRRLSHKVVLYHSIQRSASAQVFSSAGHNVPLPCLRARCRTMACDSHRIRPSSLMVGTSPLGFIARYSGVLLTPNLPPASTRSYLTLSSAQHHSTFCTLIELVRPQIFSILTPGR